MPCYHPLKGFRSKSLTRSGKRLIVFDRKSGYVDMPVTLPCGQCIGCRLEHSRQWAIRCVHEAQMHEHNCFIPLTYADEYLPPGRTLVLDHFQRFMKRLRKQNGHSIRFYHCGEYGTHYGRPHYHACLFGHRFEDARLWKQSRENPLYRSADLEKLWPFGHSSIGDVTFQSAAYVARYIVKKITGEKAEQHYQFTDPDTGEIHQQRPEYTTMSRRPGIGKTWLDKYAQDVYPHDHIILNGKKLKPPKYYNGQYEIEYPSDFAKIKRRRKEANKLHAEDQTPDRLKVRKKVKQAQLNQLKRNLE